MARYPQIEELIRRAEGAMGSREYSRRTRSAYLAWLRQFLLFNRSPHPDTLQQHHAEQFLLAETNRTLFIRGSIGRMRGTALDLLDAIELELSPGS